MSFFSVWGSISKQQIDNGPISISSGQKGRLHFVIIFFHSSIRHRGEVRYLDQIFIHNLIS